MNTFKKFTSNLTRQSEKYGDVHFISFLSAVLSRLAYCNDNTFLKNYMAIMGPVIHPQILQSINNVDSTNLSDLLDDQKIFGLNNTGGAFTDYMYNYNNKQYIDVLKLQIPQNVNIINGETFGDLTYPLPGDEPGPEDVKYISIGWTKYGEIYIVADKRMPNTIFVIFRGTYSPRTMRIYSNYQSKFALGVGKGEEKYLYGIYKSTAEMIHTIIEATTYLATTFLNAKNPKSVKIFTTGHSLGGSMCSIFSYLWMGIKQTAPYNKEPYNVLADNIVCVSLGAPRCMGPFVSDKFCNFVKGGKIMFLRITTKGDPVPSIPKSMHMYDSTQNYRHPCMKYDEQKYNEVWEDCTAHLVLRPGIKASTSKDRKVDANLYKMNYEGNLDCLNDQPRPYVLNLLSHTSYLDIKYTSAIPFDEFLKGVGITTEVYKDPADKSTVCRLIMGQKNEYKVIFFNVNKARETSEIKEELEEEKQDEKAEEEAKNNSTEEAVEGFLEIDNPLQTAGWGLSMPSMPKISDRLTRHGGPVAEDVRMTSKAFNSLIEQMTPIQGDDLCPLSGTIISPFDNNMMPVLTSDPIKKGGRRTRKNKKSKKSRKTKKRLSKKRNKK